MTMATVATTPVSGRAASSGPVPAIVGELGKLAETEASGVLPKPYQLLELSEAVAEATRRRG